MLNSIGLANQKEEKSGKKTSNVSAAMQRTHFDIGVEDDSVGTSKIKHPLKSSIFH